MADDSKATGIGNWAIGALGLGVLASVVSVLTLGKSGLVVALVILLLLVLCIGGYLWWLKLKQQTGSRRFLNWLTPSSAGVPVEVRDADSQVKLDNLRRRFLEGIQIYRSRGKDIYSVPWFVIIGESGSGKTEAIRHSNLDFPPGLNDFMQGTGGTINMDWWFTNHGVILDTAGSMVFPEVGTAGSRQWEEFLKLLKKHRPHCPINGLLLVLSVDSLVGDSRSKIEEKSGKIARQLDLIQRALDVRFPVAVLVTKCDMLTGFREFFEPIQDVELQDQMVGWSNPDPRDARFEPEKVDRYLEQVLQRLRKWRFGLLKDPLATGGPKARKTDEVDALYALPKSLSLIAPRLRLYLGKIFVAGEFSPNPLFLRGIYFTSAMQVGGDLDEAVWTALRRPDEVTGLARTFEQLMAAGQAAENSQIWERALQCYSEALKLDPGHAQCKRKVEESRKKVQGGRPFFLRDLFLEKVFKESRLVTRAKNTRRMLRRRKLLLMGVSSACFLLFLALAYLEKSRLKGRIGNQKAHWKLVSKSPFPVVIPGTQGLAPSALHYRGNDPYGTNSLVGFHQLLRQEAEKELGGMVFVPLRLFKFEDISTTRRKMAQRKVFERDIIWPLVKETRRKMVNENPPDRPGQRLPAPVFQSDALKALIRLEAEIAQGARPLAATNAYGAATNFLVPLLYYLTEMTNVPGVLDLAHVFVRTYTNEGAWPPGGLTGGDNLETNKAIDYGLSRFFTNCLRANLSLGTRIESLVSVSDRISDFENIEKKWFQAAKDGNEITPLSFPGLDDAKRKLDDALAAARTNGLFANTDDTIQKHLEQFRADIAHSGSNAVAEIQTVMVGGPTPLTNILFTQISNKLNQFTQNLKLGMAVPFETPPQASFLDDSFLKFCSPARVERAYAVRFQCYTQAYNFQGSVCNDVGQEIGKEWRFVTNLEAQANIVRGSWNSYGEGQKERLKFTCEYLKDKSKMMIVRDFMRKYRAFVTSQLEQLNRLEHVQIADLVSLYSLASNVQHDWGLSSRLPEEQQRLLGDVPGKIKQTEIDATGRFLSQLESQLGFPVLPDSSKVLTPEEVSQRSIEISQLHQALSSAIAPNDPQDPLKVMDGRLTPWNGMLAFLMDTNGTVRSYTVTVERLPEGARFRAVAISEDGKGAAEEVSMGGEKHFGPFKLDKQLVVKLKTFAGSPESLSTNQLPRWGAVSLLREGQQGQLTAVNADRKEWAVSVQARQDPSLKVRLRLIFEQPLPLGWRATGTR